ncbi:ion transporter [Parvularcula marina]|uniref:ion transporter n=1 Tax=Parvularcula marina TaxID=2292771 RepID=UPI003512510D
MPNPLHNPVFKETGLWTPGHPVFERISQGFIIASMVVMSIGTMQSLPENVRHGLMMTDMVFGVGFAAEYAMRIYNARNRVQYIFSFWGIVDFIAIIPSLFIGGTDLKALRALRLLRLVRLLKLYRTSAALQRLRRALEKVRYEFVAFAILSALVFFVASVGIYAFENEAQPEVFSSIPASMWWAVATLTTVGYGDIYPITAVGRMFTGVVLLVGLGLVAVPTGLIASALQDEDIAETDDDDPEGSDPERL